MPFLNWRELEVNASIGPHPRRGSMMSLEIPRSAQMSLVEALEEVFSRGGGELRLELPNGWALFWKEREGESRLLLAHPDAQTWIATAALTREHGLQVAARLREGELKVGEAGPVAALSNLEIELRLCREP